MVLHKDFCLFVDVRKSEKSTQVLYLTDMSLLLRDRLIIRNKRLLKFYSRFEYHESIVYISNYNRNLLQQIMRNVVFLYLSFMCLYNEKYHYN